jgi:FAD/FMN-containing dehydrogenase
MSLTNLILETRTLLGESAVITDASQMPRYTTSRRHGHVKPALMIALPQTTEQVSKLVHLCRKHKTSIVPQGGNTGLVDGGLVNADNEIIVNLSRMDKIRDIDKTGLTATVEAGTILQNLHETLAGQGLMFPLHIAAEGSAEVGGLISTNAGGTAVLRYGSMRSQVLGIEAVLPNGEIVSTLKSLAKDNTGYHLASYFIGAEGTLGIVTAATLRILPAIRQKITAIIAIQSIESALELLATFRNEANEHLSAFEFMSLASLQILVKNIPTIRFPSNTQTAPYYLLVELSSSSTITPLRDLFISIVRLALESGRVADAILAENETQSALFWQARENIPDALRVEKNRLHFDIAVPIKSLAPFLQETGAKIKTEFPEITLMPFGHLGDGNVHYNMYQTIPLSPEAKHRIQHIVFSEVDHWQGSISAEHGIGLDRKAILAKLKSPAELNAMRAIKHALDPDQCMNPGKIFDT